MTTSTPHVSRRAFTLPEVLIASTLATLVLAGVVTVFLFFGRTSLAAGHYQAMEQQLRLSLERFSDDARRATDVEWASSWQITLTVPDSTGTPDEITYLFETQGPDDLSGGLYRVTAGGSRELLVGDVANDFAFKRYKIEQPGVADNTAFNDLETKQLQINLRTLRVTPGGPALTQAAVSARYVLRNKSVNR